MIENQKKSNDTRQTGMIDNKKKSNDVRQTGVSVLNKRFQKLLIDDSFLNDGDHNIEGLLSGLY